MPNVLIRNPAGKILLRDGKVAFGPVRCCPPCECGGCSGGASSSLLVEIDAAAAFGNPTYVGGMGCGGDPICHCYGCHLLTGSYLVTRTFDSPTSCHWEASFPGPGYQTICNGNESDNGAVDTIISITIYFDGSTYWAQLFIDFGVKYYIWYKNLGPTKPVCSEIFPMTFVRAESVQQEFFDFFGEVGEPCDMRFIDITVNVP